MAQIIALKPCSRCYAHGSKTVPGTILTVYGPYCAPCFERDKESIAQGTRQAREHRAAYLRRLSEMGERFEDRTFANFRIGDGNRGAFAAAQDAWETKGGLYLHGVPGNGKTHLAAAIANAAIAADVETIFVTGIGLLQRIREVYRRREGGESERGMLAHYADVRMLVLDDLGTEPFTADTGRLFYALVNRRYEQRNLKLIVTSNLSLADLVNQWRKSGVESHVGDKIADRIRELCENRFVRIDAASERGKAPS